MQFNPSAAAYKRMGEEFVPDWITALVELVKNAYDADATLVRIEINTKEMVSDTRLFYKNSDKGFVTITDNGIGMSRRGVEADWLNFSGSAKQYGSQTRLGRTRVGGKGIGKSGTHRLGTFVEVITSDGRETTHAGFSWNDFDERPLKEIPARIEPLLESSEPNTTLYLYPLPGTLYLQQAAVEQLTNRLRPFIDKKSFNVELSVDGVVTRISTIFLKRETRPVSIENVWQHNSPQVTNEVLRFWEDNKMLRPGFPAADRAGEVVLIVRNRESKIVGLSTAGVVKLKQLNNNAFYLYRSIVLPAYRHPGLADKLIVETRDFLENFNKEVTENVCVGILVFVENLRLQQFRREAVWRASRMAYIGRDKEGRHIRVYYFKGARI